MLDLCGSPVSKHTQQRKETDVYLFSFHLLHKEHQVLEERSLRLEELTVPEASDSCFFFFTKQVFAGQFGGLQAKLNLVYNVTLRNGLPG